MRNLIGPLCWACLLVLAPGVLVAGELIKPCERPLELHLRRLASAALPAAHHSVPICQLPFRTELRTGSLAPGLKLSLDSSGSGVRLKLELGTSLRAEQPLRIDSREVPAAWRGGGPPFLVRLETELRPDLFKVSASAVPAQRVAIELAAVSGYQLSGLESLADASFSADLEQIGTEPLLGRLADAAQLQVQRVGRQRYRFGRIHQADLVRQLLETIGDGREAALQEVLRLSQAASGDELGVEPDGILQELAVNAADRGDFDQARGYCRQLLARSAALEERSEPEVDSLRHAGWLVLLARIELRAGAAEAAAPLLERAVRLLEAQQGRLAEDLPKVLLLQAQLPLYKSRPAESFALFERGLSIMELTGQPPARQVPLLEGLATLQERTGAWALAAELRQRLVGIELELYGAGDERVALQQTRLAAALEKGAQYGAAQQLWETLLQHSPERLSARRARALRGLAVLGVSSGAPQLALRYWQEMLALRTALLGEAHPLSRATALEIRVLEQLVLVHAGKAEAGLAPPEQGVAAMTAGATDSIDRLAADLREELVHNLLDEGLLRISGDLDSALNMPPAARAARLEFRAELQLGLSGRAGLGAARRDYTAALQIRQKMAARQPATQSCAARLAAIEQMSGPES